MLSRACCAEKSWPVPDAQFCGGQSRAQGLKATQGCFISPESLLSRRHLSSGVILDARKVHATYILRVLINCHERSLPP
jgi:hypothetical protein